PDAEVARIVVKEGAVTGVALNSGEEFAAHVVASNADANVTFNRLLDNRLLPPSFAEAVNRISYDSASLKINVALSELPDFKACHGQLAARATSGQPGPQHRGTIHICPDTDYLERAYD